MAQLTPLEWKKLDGIILDLHSLETTKEFEHFILHRMAQFLGAKFASWNEHNAYLYLERVTNSSEFEPIIAPLVPALNRTLSTHPVFNQFFDMQSGKVCLIETVERTREHTTSAQYHALPFYREVASQVGVEDQLLMHVSIKDGRGILLTFHGEREFTEAELLKAAILRGHILARFHSLQRQCEQRLKSAREVQDALGELLTRREFEILRWLCTGKTNAEISGVLGISKRTVDNHVGNILAKLEMESRTHVISRYASWLDDVA